ncbi:enoyl-CoA hydratase/isomerase family protein [Cupriavidus pauculus]|uniref:Enoyl-CoA hydratase/isomerase family protein n=1 Tax=Cupriavidus pauculus TaxID=82633 RepID=A0A2N5CEB1_9BURK|nr:enoyl-CoA hydratase/isomerase family protein [Cupriavidus pauculus]PLQ00525.1 enoyl-CoA hydratase/isomerase family protein [Cupriavidus pauculus]
MNASPLLQHWDGDTCRLTLNRPAQGNALSRELVDALDAAFEDCARRGAAMVVLDGAGRHFCTGFDLSGLDEETDDSLLARFTRIELMLQRVARAPFHTVAVAQGRVMGAGADLFAACTQRVAVAGATFAFPGARGFGLVLGSRRLAACVGTQRAREWITSGGTIHEAEALAAGLATECVESAGPILRDAGRSGAETLLDRAIDGNAELDDARDLAALVRSAAAAGLRQRVADYVARQAQARKTA